MRFLLEQDGEKISISRDFRRYIIKPEAEVVYSFDDEGKLNSKYSYITQRLDARDDPVNDLREFCMLIIVGSELPITPQERSHYGTESLT